MFAGLFLTSHGTWKVFLVAFLPVSSSLSLQVSLMDPRKAGEPLPRQGEPRPGRGVSAMIQFSSTLLASRYKQISLSMTLLRDCPSDSGFMRMADCQWVMSLHLHPATLPHQWPTPRSGREREVHNGGFPLHQHDLRRDCLVRPAKQAAGRLLVAQPLDECLPRL